MKHLMQDLRIATRTLRRTPGFALVVILTFAVGIGANTTVFSVVDGVLVRPLSYDEPDRLVMLWETNPQLTSAGVSVPNFNDWRTLNRAFETIAAWDAVNVNLTGRDMAERITAARVTDGFFTAMRVQPRGGRLLLSDDQLAGNDLVAVLHHDLWQRRYGGDPQLVGTAVEIDGVLRKVVGIAPEGFSFPAGAQVWLPLGNDATGDLRHNHILAVIGRLNPDFSVEQAQAEMSRVSALIADEYPEMDGWGSRVVPLADELVGGARSTLLLLMAAVTLVLLIASANVAGLLFARSASRTREVALRKAIGARSGRVIRLFLVESTLLAVLGGGLGIILSIGGIAGLKRLAGSSLPRMDAVGLDWRVVAFTGLITIATGAVAGLLPALRSLRTPPNAVLSEGRSASMGGDQSRKRLIVAQVAVAVTLLVTAGLLMESLIRLNRVDVGFTARSVLTLRIGPEEAAYSNGSQVVEFYARALDAIRGIPGVEAASAVSDLPIGPAYGYLFVAMPGEPIVPVGRQPITAKFHVISPEYHQTMGIPVVRGRTLDERDGSASSLAIVISELMATRLWPGVDPIGRRLQLEYPGLYGTVVGVVGEVRQGGLRANLEPAIYFAQEQIASHPALSPITQVMWREMALAIRTSGDPAELVQPVRQRIAELDPRLPVYGIQTIEELRDRSAASDRFTTVLFVTFAALAMLLATIGIYGLVAYMIAARRAEIGLRIALGAAPDRVVRSFVGQGMMPVGIGLVIGLLGAFGLTRLLSNLVFGLDAFGLQTVIAVAVFFGGFALVACIVPAIRAARLDPMAALVLD